MPYLSPPPGHGSDGPEGHGADLRPRCHFTLETIDLFTTDFWPLRNVCDIPEALIQACCPKQIHNLFKRRLSPLGVAVKPVLLTRPLMCTCLYAWSSLSLCSVDLSSSTRDFYMRKESIRGCTNPWQSCLQRTALEGKTTFLFFFLYLFIDLNFRSSIRQSRVPIARKGKQKKSLFRLCLGFKLKLIKESQPKTKIWDKTWIFSKKESNSSPE